MTVLIRDAQGTAQRIRMGESGREFDKFAGQAGHHVPAPMQGRSRRDVAKVEQQAFACWRIVDIAAQNLEIDKQPLPVFDNAGLRGIDLGLVRSAATTVFDAHAQREGVGRLDLGVKASSPGTSRGRK